MSFERLTADLIGTVAQPANWQAALAQICDYTASSKALLSLRDLKTAEIVVPKDVAAELASPLIYGFSEPEVEAYLGHFAKHDPWTQIEQQNHPYYPYAMSRYLPLAQLKQSLFWDWLSPQGIQDCVVCEVGRKDQYWAALTLYFEDAGPDKSDLVLQRLRGVLPTIRSAWMAGRELQIAKSVEGSLDMVLAAIDEPAALLERNGTLIASNTAMTRQTQLWDIMAGQGQRLSLPTDLPVVTDGCDAFVANIQKSPPQTTDLQANVTIFDRFQTIDGEPRDIVLLTLSVPEQANETAEDQVWDNPSLTPREKELLQIIAPGERFVDSQEKMELSYPRIMQLWKSARAKLDLRDVNELRLAYELRKKS